MLGPLITFARRLSLDDVREMVGMAMYAFIFYAPLLFLAVCAVLYAMFGAFTLGFILLAYLCSCLATTHPREKPWRWLRLSRVWTWLRRGVRGKVLIDGEIPEGGHGNCVLGFHPHGTIPLTISWLASSDEIESFLGSSQTADRLRFLASSLLFYLPFVRDICVGDGRFVEATKGLFADVLRTGRSVILCPGGVREMYIAQGSPGEDRVLRVLTRHKGFVRCALEHGYPLVPVLSFGEQELFDVSRPFPGLEGWVERGIGRAVGVPWFSGRWGLPIPRDVPVTVVIGQPIRVDDCDGPGKAHTDETVDKYHKMFYTALEDLFNRYKDHPDVGIRYARIQLCSGDDS